MQNRISKYIQIFDKRIFIDVASDGCGSGCIYCFTKHPTRQQTLLSDDVINYICDEIIKLPNCNEMIISLCPNTEPMKSNESIELIKIIIGKLATKVKFIQIATKEKIPVEFLGFLNRQSQFEGQIRLSVSLPYIYKNDLIEPKAESVYNRLINFDNIKKFSNLVSILYLRPFNKQMLVAKKDYAELIEKYKPDNICLGAEFVPRVDGEQLCTYMYNTQLAEDIFKNVRKEDIFYFANYLRETVHCKIFYSSICNIANCSDYGCILKLYNHDLCYCKDCILI
jgi:hypothetical protein